MDLAVLGIVLGVVFVAELPDKSLFATVLLGRRYHPVLVWCGVAAAFLVHVVIAVAAGRALRLLPHPLVAGVVAVLFLAGAAYLVWHREEEADAPPRPAHGVVLTAFSVVFVGEWGDVTQIATANYSARYGDPLAVGLGALLALWAVALIGVTAGAKVLARVPDRMVRYATAAVLLVFAALSAVEAVRG